MTPSDHSPYSLSFHLHNSPTQTTCHPQLMQERAPNQTRPVSIKETITNKASTPCVWISYVAPILHTKDGVCYMSMSSTRHISTPTHEITINYFNFLKLLQSLRCRHDNIVSSVIVKGFIWIGVSEHFNARNYKRQAVKSFGFTK